MLLGCQAAKEQLGLDDAPGEAVSTVKADVGSATPDVDNTPPPRAVPRAKAVKPTRPESDLATALTRAIVRGEPGEFRIDPFVLTLVADTLGRNEDLPFKRVSKKERKAGIPHAFRVGKLPRKSLWRRLGLKPGDLIVSVQDIHPPGPKGLSILRKKIAREGSIDVELVRDGEDKTFRYTIEPGLAWTRYLEDEAGRTFEPPTPASKPARPSSGTPPRSSKPSSKPSKPAAVPVTCSRGTCRVPKPYFDSLVGSSSKAKQQVRGKSIRSGYKVTFVGPAARKAGFAVGDVVTKINGSRTNNQLAMLGLYSRLKSTKKFRVESTRGGRKRVTTLIVE